MTVPSGELEPRSTRRSARLGSEDRSGGPIALPTTIGAWCAVRRTLPGMPDWPMANRLAVGP